MNIAVQTTVLPVNIHVNGRVDHGMIKRRVKHGLMIFRPLAFDDIQFAFPLVVCFLADLLETLARSLGTKVL